MRILDSQKRVKVRRSLAIILSLWIALAIVYGLFTWLAVPRLSAYHDEVATTVRGYEHRRMPIRPPDPVDAPTLAAPEREAETATVERMERSPVTEAPAAPHEHHDVPAPHPSDARVLWWIDQVLERIESILLLIGLAGAVVNGKPIVEWWRKRK